MAYWKKLVLIAAGFGSSFAIVIGLMIGTWAWYQGRPATPNPWNANAIVATFDHPEQEIGQPNKGPDDFQPVLYAVYYDLENTTQNDYYLPPRGQLQLAERLRRENSLSDGRHFALDEEPIFIPAKQRRRIAVHLFYPDFCDVGPEGKHARSARWKLITGCLKRDIPDLNGFVLFDTANRYQINLPNGWDNFEPK